MYIISPLKIKVKIQTDKICLFIFILRIQSWLNIWYWKTYSIFSVVWSWSMFWFYNFQSWEDYFHKYIVQNSRRMCRTISKIIENTLLIPSKNSLNCIFVKLKSTIQRAVFQNQTYYYNTIQTNFILTC